MIRKTTSSIAAQENHVRSYWLQKKREKHNNIKNNKIDNRTVRMFFLTIYLIINIICITNGK